MRRALVPLALAAALAAAPEAQAFCGFYVGGAGAKLFNNATQVALMRDGTRTVLSMANNYQGPPSDFAMVVPVPVVLQKENVKTLPHDLFARLDQLSSPRLVEYWEQDPCPSDVGFGFGKGKMDMAPAPAAMAPPKAADKAPPVVKIEAQFVVGEYDIVILSASDSMGLDAWLRQNGYNIPKGAEEYLRPYVQGGMKFFVAKVDMSKVKKEGEKTMLSPLRFYYDSDTFALPIRLGLANANGMQDLIVHVLGLGQRYEVANYPNVAIPTNLNVKNSVKQQFGSFYAALFDQTLKKHPKAVVTEYSWDASSCDPCPGPPLNPQDLSLLGLDVTSPGGVQVPLRGRRGFGGSITLTRLHTRYSRDTLGEDLVFREAKPIVGGREFVTDDGGNLEKGARPDDINNFQARYAIRYPWMGPVTCKNPQRGVWGGPPNDTSDEPTQPALNLAFVARRNIDPFPLIKTNAPVEATPLGAAERVATTMPQGLLAAPPASSAAAPEPVPDDSAAPAPSASPLAPAPPPPPPARGGCAGCQAGSSQATLPAALSLLAAALLRLRRRRSS